jgi:hypothetical protein
MHQPATCTPQAGIVRPKRVVENEERKWFDPNRNGESERLQHLYEELNLTFAPRS